MLIVAGLALSACAVDASGEVGAGANRTGAAAAVVTLPAPTATATVPPTFTPVPTITNTPTPGPSPTPSKTPTRTPRPTDTPAPTATPTSVPQLVNPVPQFGTTESSATGMPVTAVPTAVPTFEVPSEVTNILLLGSDMPLEDGVARTDTMIIVSINRRTRTASMLSLPRDMYVYVPGWKMSRINSALAHGSAVVYPTGPVGQLKDTILYNFGVPIHYFARVDIEGFQEVVDAIGGVEVAVSCPVEIPYIVSPEPNLEIEIRTLEPGIYDMDGELALWYARSRTGSHDFDRNRRQQQVLRALFNKGVDIDLLSQVPALYDTYRDTVETDLDIGRVLQLAALAPTIRENGVQHLYITNEHLEPWTVPETGAAVQLPKWDEMEELFYRLLTPPVLNSGARPPIFVELVNGTNNPDLALLAADNLAWYGFVPVISPADRHDYEQTTISYYADNFKSSFDWLLSWIFGQRTNQIELISNAPYDYDYRVVLGADYNPCVNRLYAPQPDLP